MGKFKLIFGGIILIVIGLILIYSWNYIKDSNILTNTWNWITSVFGYLKEKVVGIGR